MGSIVFSRQQIFLISRSDTETFALAVVSPRVIEALSKSKSMPLRLSLSNSTKSSCIKKNCSELLTQKNSRKFYLYLSKKYATDFYQFEPIIVQYLKQLKLNTETKRQNLPA